MIKRTNGFLDLDSYQKDKNARMFVKKSSYSSDHFWITLGDDVYYFKPAHFPTKELVASQMAKDAGFDAVTYDLARFNDTYGLISKSYRKNGATYITMTEILNKYFKDNPDINYEMGLNEKWSKATKNPAIKFMTNLMTYWQALEYYFGNERQAQIKNIMDELVRRYFFNIIIGNYDNNSQNHEIEVSENGIKMATMFDNELSFAPRAEVGLSTDYSDSNDKFYESLVYFFTVSSSEYIEVFQELFSKIDLDLLEGAIDKVEMQIEATLPDNQKETLKTRLADTRKVIKVALRENGIFIKRK